MIRSARLRFPFNINLPIKRATFRFLYLASGTSGRRTTLLRLGKVCLLLTKHHKRRLFDCRVAPAISYRRLTRVPIHFACLSQYPQSGSKSMQWRTPDTHRIFAVPLTGRDQCRDRQRFLSPSISTLVTFIYFLLPFAAAACPVFGRLAPYLERPRRRFATP